ncbi:MAG: peptidoglycan synthetase [Salinivirgaceae bacterium]|nr:peptidoglycan synthetase [Salinivirgaceae bacterium]
MHYHFIAIGGSAMHNLAIALHKKGEKITGSDDEIFEPSRSRLLKYGILPEKEGWSPEKISTGIDAIVLGMHAKSDNPELLKAKELGLTIYSYPEFLYNQTKNKTRVVIGGSHGKTSTTAMIMHVLNKLSMDFDYMVGAQLEGFDTMVNFSDTSKIAVFEGDEYLTSPIDLRPKFHLYQPHIALITGIAWDHINVFPTFENYVSQFAQFVELIEDGGSLVYFEGDEILRKIVSESKRKIKFIPYNTHSNKVEKGITTLIHGNEEIPLKIFGNHNLQNLSGALFVCKELGITENEFYNAISSFEGASKRLQLLGENSELAIYQDFAHSPSKLTATINSVKEQFPEKQIIACMELHTYSSLSKSFLKEYKGSMQMADKAIVFFSNHALELKRLQKIEKSEIFISFDKQGLKVINDTEELKKELNFMEFNNSILLFLSSGNFGGVDIKQFACELMKKTGN